MRTPPTPTPARDAVRPVAPKLIELSEKVRWPAAMTAGQIVGKVFDARKP